MHDTSTVLLAYRACWNRQHGPRLQHDLDARGHVRAQEAALVVVDGNSGDIFDDVVHDGRARIDRHDLAGEVLCREGIYIEDDALPDLNLADVHLVNKGVYLEPLQIDDREECGRGQTGRDCFALLCGDGCNDT